MNFEMMLAQLMSLPVKFLVGECMTIYDKHKENLPQDQELYEKEKQEHVANLDIQMKSIKIPRILIERLQKEFDDSHSLST